MQNEYSYEILMDSLTMCLQDSDPLFSQSPWKNKLTGSDGETLGGFPVKFLVQVVSMTRQTGMFYVVVVVVVGGFPENYLIHFLSCLFQTRLSKILMIKKEHIKHLKEMNTEAEKLVLYTFKNVYIFLSCLHRVLN